MKTIMLLFIGLCFMAMILVIFACLTWSFVRLGTKFIAGKMILSMAKDFVDIFAETVGCFDAIRIGFDKKRKKQVEKITKMQNKMIDEE